MLHNVLAALVDALGFSTTAKTGASGTEGNVVFMHLMLDALPLQPCNPTCTFYIERLLIIPRRNATAVGQFVATASRRRRGTMTVSTPMTVRPRRICWRHKLLCLKTASPSCKAPESR